MQNIQEPITSSAETDIKGFIDKASLLTNLDDSVKEKSVSLMTLHSEGSRISVVFIIGLEEGVLPI